MTALDDADIHDNPDLRRLAEREPSRLANAIADVVHPFVCGSVMVIAVALHACWPRVGAGLGWGLVALACAIGLPGLVLLLSLRAGWVSDPNVVRQDERLGPLAVGIVAVCLAVLLCWAAGVPHVVVDLLVAMVATVGVLTILTVVEKVSFHAAGAAALMAVMGVVSRSGWWWGAVALLAVGWARVRAGRHTLRQVLLGALTGGVVAGGAFALLTR